MPVYWVVSTCGAPYIRGHMLSGQLSEHLVSYTLPVYEPDAHAENDDRPDTPTPD